MHKKYVICPIGKARKNFGIVCKTFYIEVLKKELGITYRIIGNSVYKPVSESTDEIIEKHVTQMKSDFNINIPKLTEVFLIYIGLLNNIKIHINSDSLLVPNIVLLNYCLLNLLWP